MNGTTYNDYLIEAVRLRKLYNEAVKSKNAKKEQEYEDAMHRLHYSALALDGIDIYELRLDEYRTMYGKEPSATALESITKAMNEDTMLRDMVELKNRYATAPEWEKASLEAEMDTLRMKIQAFGFDPWEFSVMALEFYLGRVPTAKEIKAENSLVTKAVAAYNKLSQAKKNELKKPTIPNSIKNAPKVSKFAHRDLWGSTYSGADMTVFLAFPGYKPMEVGMASTVSYTTYREKKQVRTLGRVSAKGITKGPRTVSGRLIFTVLNEHIVESLRREIPYLRDIKTILMDELPAFDLLISFGNEYGGGAGLVIQGITTVDEQKTFSIEDMFTENIFTYLARLVQPMRDLQTTSISEPYDPLSWMGSDFRPAGSESLARFQVKELMVYKESLLLADPTPFLGGPDEWDSKDAGTLDVADNGMVGGSNSGDSGGGSSEGDDSGGSGSGDSAVPKGKCKVHVFVYDGDTKDKKAISGATVTGSSFTTKYKTDKTGQVHFFISNKDDSFAAGATKSGWKVPAVKAKTNPALVKIKGKKTASVNLPLYKKPSGTCTGNDAKFVTKVSPYGYWYSSKNATLAHVTPEESGHIKRYPNCSVRVKNKCGEAISGVTVDWSYKVTNWSKVKGNKPVGGIFTKSKESGEIGKSKTNSLGTSVQPDYDFYRFPRGSKITITAKAHKSKLLMDQVASKLHIKFYFKVYD